MIRKELKLPEKLFQKAVKKIERCGYASFNEYLRRLLHDDLDGEGMEK